MSDLPFGNSPLPPDLPPIPEHITQDHASALASAPSTLVQVAEDVLKEQALQMYMANIMLPDISERMNIHMDVLRKWKKEDRWELLRLQAQCPTNADHSLVAATTNPGTVLKQTTGRALRAITKAVQDIDEDLQRNMKLQVKDVKALTEIFATLDKISRLEQGKATDIIDTRTLSYSEAVHIIRQDPFARNIVRADDG